MRFYLRKIEGAEILLAHETNFFRTELHRWMPIAPNPPPVIDCSNSTRKPRPTKQQKLMAQYGVNTPEELPMTLRTKAHTFKKKTNEPNKPAPIKPAPHKGSSHPPSSSMSPVQMHTPTHNLNHPQFDYGSSRYSLSSSSSQVSPQYNQQPPQMSTSPILMGSLRGGASMDPLLNNYHSRGSSLRESSRERDQVNHMFETLTNQEDNLYTGEPVSSSSASTSSNSSATPSVSASTGGPSSSSSAPPSLAAAALQLAGDPIDPFLTDTAMRD